MGNNRNKLRAVSSKKQCVRSRRAAEKTRPKKIKSSGVNRRQSQNTTRDLSDTPPLCGAVFDSQVPKQNLISANLDNSSTEELSEFYGLMHDSERTSDTNTVNPSVSILPEHASISSLTERFACHQIRESFYESTHAGTVRHGVQGIADTIAISDCTKKHDFCKVAPALSRSLNKHDSITVESERLPNEAAVAGTVEIGHAPAPSVSSDMVIDEESHALEMTEIPSEFLPEACLIKNVDIDGYRIADFNYVLMQLSLQIHEHSKVCKHSITESSLVKYTDRGLKTIMHFKCGICDYRFHIWNVPGGSGMGINEMAFCGSITAGSGCYGTQEILASLSIPFYSHEMYGRYREKLFDSFKDVAMESMAAAAEKERAIAIGKKHVINGVPWIQVIADGSWPKRTYASGKHDSLSGVAFIIGYETGLIVYVGVRNKYCATCLQAERSNREPRKHVCYKNWGKDQSSTSMESDIICAGFKTSIQQHGLIYKTLISDGDSSSIQAIRNANPYAEHNIVVDKVECSNHLFRNLCRKLKEASKIKIAPVAPCDGDLTLGKLRKVVHNSGLVIKNSVKLARDFRKKEELSDHEKSRLLQKDILTIFPHTFGNHSECVALSIPCNSKPLEKDLTRQLQATGIYPIVFEAVRYLSCHADSLLQNVTNNLAESANSIVNKLISGKRPNYCQRNSYEMRCYGSVVQHNSQDLLSKQFLHMRMQVPTAVAKMEESRQLHVRNNKHRHLERGTHRYRSYHGTDKDYGPSAQKPDLPPDVYNTLKENHFNKLTEYQNDREQIERDTVLQSDSGLWTQIRTNILTASTFGKICRMYDTTSCAASVQAIRYPKVLDVAAVQFGLANEVVAREALESKLGKRINPCGLFIDRELSYIGATPDGLIDNDVIVEIKCSFSARNAYLTDESIELDKNLRRIFDKKNKNLLNKTHHYFYQVQGQLHVTQRSYCIFAVWTSVDLKCIEVFRDDEFWRTEMEPLLSRFYKECMVPEIVDPRYTRNMPIRDPEYILNAQTRSELKKNLNVNGKRENNVKQNIQQKKSPVSSCSQIDVVPCTEVPQSVPDVVFSSLNRQAISHERWGHVDMDDDMEIVEEHRQLLLNVRTNGSLDEVIANIMELNSLLSDTTIDFFQCISETITNFEFQPASYTAYYRYIEPFYHGQDLQIIGGNRSAHWSCVHYDGSNLMIYDSMCPVEYHFLHEETKRYIEKRYPNLVQRNMFLQPVTRQPDCFSCGVYAIAFATAVALGEDPSQQNYSCDVLNMRTHLVTIVRTRQLIPFPTL